MKKRTRSVLNCILVLILLFGATKYILSKWENYRSQQDYDQAIQIAYGQPTEETAPAESIPDPTEEPEPTEEITVELPDDPLIQELMAIDLAALREENEDIIGWICIPDSNVNYPLLQWTDNYFYLKHTWKQKPNTSGSIFMGCDNASDFSDFNTIIYGHNMNNADMFGSLSYYRRPDYRENHPYIYIVNDEGVFRYDIFAAQTASTTSIIYGLGIDTDQRKTEFIRFAKDYSYFESELTPTIDDRILTLSTCTGSSYATRWVVLSILNEEHSYKRPA